MDFYPEEREERSSAAAPAKWLTLFSSSGCWLAIGSDGNISYMIHHPRRWFHVMGMMIRYTIHVMVMMIVAPSKSSHSSASALCKAASKWSVPVEGKHQGIEVFYYWTISTVYMTMMIIDHWSWFITQHSNMTGNRMHKTQLQPRLNGNQRDRGTSLLWNNWHLDTNLLFEFISFRWMFLVPKFPVLCVCGIITL